MQEVLRRTFRAIGALNHHIAICVIARIVHLVVLRVA